MKNIFLTIIVLTGLNVFAQQIPNRLVNPNTPVYVFEFNTKIDEAVYNKIQGITMITDFKILINKNKVLFHSLGSDEKLFVNINRSELEEIIKNDSRDKQTYFYVFIKNENKYYAVDHIRFRNTRD
ncbi:hypothetical protein IRZ83_18905 [Flavobacterium sp. JLP]|uniref:hypothetical protein n=1 Tax=Flavobacterium sp. JLP TaxID=2783793 RepID=UPI00188C4F8A|nr:hypothetical protein [Flavobacterium sp. JLP]MBF4508748.1 hypothetical protein [Flavobacterium sp. JLP]